MLKSLSIENYALIDKVELQLDKGLTALTGETGTGKSIILGAISLIMGQRADTSILADVNKKCIVEAIYIYDDDEIKNFIKEYDLDEIPDNNIIIRREISAKGKSRAFINDTPVQLNVLKNISALLIDLNTQYQKFSLSDRTNQLKYLDLYIDKPSELKEYQKYFIDYKTLLKQKEEISEKLNKLSQEEEYYKFLNKELTSAELHANEDNELENELRLLENIDDIKLKLISSLDKLSENETVNCLSALHDIQLDINSITEYIAGGESIASRLDNIYIEIKEITHELNNINDNIEPDSNRMNYLSERLDMINNLLRKFKANSVEELLKISSEIEAKLQDIDILSEKLSSLEACLSTQKQKLIDKSLQLSALRQKFATKLSKEVSAILKELGISNGDFIVELTEDTNNLTKLGCNEVNFIFSANKGGQLLPLLSVASGGELSRVMLALKTVLIQKKTIPTVIFDEIDSGISGATALKVGNKLHEMSSSKVQVIAITHLAQIAAKANHHFLVYKEVSNEKTFTRVDELSENDRVEAIAAMLSGDTITKEAIENAKSLMSII